MCISPNIERQRTLDWFVVDWSSFAFQGKTCLFSSNQYPFYILYSSFQQDGPLPGISRIITPLMGVIAPVTRLLDPS